MKSLPRLHEGSEAEIQGGGIYVVIAIISHLLNSYSVLGTEINVLHYIFIYFY